MDFDTLAELSVKMKEDKTKKKKRQVIELC